MTTRELIVLPDRFDERTPIPRGRDLYYQCGICSGVIPSQPKDNMGCACGNAFVDVDAFRVAIKDYSQFRILQKVKKNRTGRARMSAK